MGVKQAFETTSWVTKLVMGIVIAGIIGWATLVTNAATTSQNASEVKVIANEQIAGSQILTRGAQKQIDDLVRATAVIEQRQISIENQLGSMNSLLLQHQRSLIRVETLLEARQVN